MILYTVLYYRTTGRKKLPRIFCTYEVLHSTYHQYIVLLLASHRHFIPTITLYRVLLYVAPRCDITAEGIRFLSICQLSVCCQRQRDVETVLERRRVVSFGTPRLRVFFRRPRHCWNDINSVFGMYQEPLLRSIYTLYSTVLTTGAATILIQYNGSAYCSVPQS